MCQNDGQLNGKYHQDMTILSNRTKSRFSVYDALSFVLNQFSGMGKLSSSPENALCWCSKEIKCKSVFNKDEEDDSWLDEEPGDENEAEVSPEVVLEARTSLLIDFNCKLLSGILSDTQPAKILTTENKSTTLAISP